MVKWFGLFYATRMASKNAIITGFVTGVFLSREDASVLMCLSTIASRSVLRAHKFSKQSNNFKRIIRGSLSGVLFLAMHRVGLD